MNRLLIRLAAIGLYAAMVNIAQAQSSKVSYTYLELNYVGSETNVSGFGDIDGDGALFGGSAALSDWLHVLASYETRSLDDVTIDDGMGTLTTTSFDDIDITSVGVGVHAPLNYSGGRGSTSYSDRYSTFFDAQWHSADGATGDDMDGWSVDAGVRAVNFTSWEFIGALGYENFEGIEGEITARGQLLYRLLEDLQLQAGIDWNDNVTSIFIGARYNFDDFDVF